MSIVRSAFNNSKLTAGRVLHHAIKPYMGGAVLLCAITFLLSAPETVLAQSQFRSPQIPAAKTIGGQLISGRFSSQDELTPIRPVPTTSEKPEFEFAPQSSAGSSNPISLGPSITIKNATSDPQPSRFVNDRTDSIDQFLGQQGFERLPPPMDDITNDRTPEGLEVIKQRFPDGKPQIIRHVAQDDQGNYYNEGPWEARNPSGQVVAAGSYRQGRMHGQWRRQHDADSGGLFETKPFTLFQGPFLSVARFNDGKLDGLWTIYDHYRQKIFEIPYKDGIRDGTAHWFYPNNSKMRAATFKQGLIDGEILNWNEGEKLVKREQYVDGRRIVRNTTFYRPEVKKTEDYFLGSKLEPEAEDNWWEAKPTPFLPQGSETQNGPSMAWYENSQPKKQGQYKNGEPIGRFIWWHSNGNKQIEGFYAEGKKTRRWTWWYENGMKQIEGVYEDSEPTGVWKSWHPDGELRKEQDFSGDDVTPDIRRPKSRNTDGDSEDFEIEPAFEVLPTPIQTDLETPGSEAEAMEGISPLEFREPGTPDPAFDATDGSTDESQSDNRESIDILEGFFDDSDSN